MDAYISGLHHVESPTRENLDRKAMQLTSLIRHNDSEKMNRILMDEYNDFVKDVLIAENELIGFSDSSIVQFQRHTFRRIDR